MKLPISGLPVVYLHPGEIFYGNKPTLITTILGSCLSITMFSKKTKYSAISHCQLPFGNKRGVSYLKCTEPYKYVDCTITKMLETFEKMSIPKEEIEIKIFGGGDVIATRKERENPKTIGKQNIIAAINLFNKYELSVTASDIGGKEGRKIFFVTDTGEIYLKRLKVNEKN